MLQRVRAIDNQIYVLSCSPARPPQGDDGYPAYGFSMAVDPTGTVVVSASEPEETVYVDVSVDLINETRRNVPVTVQRRFDAYPDVAA